MKKEGLGWLPAHLQVCARVAKVFVTAATMYEIARSRGGRYIVLGHCEKRSRSVDRLMPLAAVLSSEGDCANQKYWGCITDLASETMSRQN